MKVKLMESTSNSNAAMLTTFEPHEECGIEWSNTTKELKAEFMKTWELAYQILNGKQDTNGGHNIMSVLESLGNMINANKVPQHWDFDFTYKKAVEELISELNDM